MDAEPTQIRRRRLVRVGLLAVLVALGAGVLFVVRTNHPNTFSFFPRCQLHALTGLHCPGCGMTRSVHALLNGEVSQALAYNVLWPIALPLLAFALGKAIWMWAWGDAQRSGERKKGMPTWVPYTLVAALLAFGIARNIPYHPFTLLAPHELK